MKRFLLLIVTYAFTNCNQGQVSPARLDSLVSTYTRLKSFNGSVLVAEKRKILLEKGYGIQNKKDNAPNTANTIYQIGSITKQFTSAIILQLVEKQKLNLQDKLSKFIPDYPKGDSITVEQLLTHTAGIYNYTNDTHFMSVSSERPISRDSLLYLFKNKPLDFSPGTSWSYSNSGYILLGLIIEKVTGKSYFRLYGKIFSSLWICTIPDLILRISMLQIKRSATQAIFRQRLASSIPLCHLLPERYIPPLGICINGTRHCIPTGS